MSVNDHIIDDDTNYTNLSSCIAKFNNLSYKYEQLSEEQILQFQRIILIIYASNTEDMTTNRLIKNAHIEEILSKIREKYSEDMRIYKIFDILIGNAILFDDINMLQITLPKFLTERYILSVAEGAEYTENTDLIMYRALNIIRTDFYQIMFSSYQIRMIAAENQFKSKYIKELMEKFTYPVLNPQMIRRIIRYNFNSLARITTAEKLEESLDHMISGLQDSNIFYTLDQFIFGPKINLSDYQNQTINGSIFDALTGWGKAIIIQANAAANKIKK
jgi:hypothetical protein